MKLTKYITNPLVVGSFAIFAVGILYCVFPQKRWEKLYYFFAGVGGIAAFFAIAATYHQTQKNVKKDLFLRSAEFIIDELYAFLVEISYHWTNAAWREYVGYFINVSTFPATNTVVNPTPEFWQGHKNKTTLLIHTVEKIKEFRNSTPAERGDNYTPQKNKIGVWPTAKLYNTRFKKLLEFAEESNCSDLAEIYKTSYLGKFDEEIRRTLSEESK